MFLTVRRHLAPCALKSCSHGTGVMQATSVVNVPHAVLCMLVAVLRRLSTLGVEASRPGTGVMRATPSVTVSMPTSPCRLQ